MATTSTTYPTVCSTKNSPQQTVCHCSNGCQRKAADGTFGRLAAKTALGRLGGFRFVWQKDPNLKRVLACSHVVFSGLFTDRLLSLFGFGCFKFPFNAKTGERSTRLCPRAAKLPPTYSSFVRSLCSAIDATSL